MLTIAIGTKNPAKIKAIQGGVSKIPELTNKEIIYVLQKVKTWVPDMPLTQKDIDEWARNRAENLIKEGIIADFYIGLEWWCYQTENIGFLTGSVYITNGKKWYFWKAPSLQLPQNITKKLYENKKDLWELMKEITKNQNISKENGAFWTLSNNIITRDKSFEIATLLAINPFFNLYYTKNSWQL